METFNAFDTFLMSTVINKYGTPCRFLWHYTNEIGLNGILNNESVRLWFTDFRCFSDHTEGEEIMRHYRLVCNRLYRNHEISPEFYEIIKDVEPKNEQLFSKSEDDATGTHVHAYRSEYRAFVCCFCMKEDSLFMWNRYAKGEHGYSLRFSQDDLLKYLTRNKNICPYEIYPVIYTKEEKEQLLSDAIKSSFDSYQKNNDSHGRSAKTIAQINTLLSTLRFIFKDSQFKEEHECRVVLYLTKESENGVTIQTRKGPDNTSDIHYVQIDIPKCEIDTLCVRITPYNTDANAVEKTKNTLLENGYPQAYVLKSSISMKQ